MKRSIACALAVMTMASVPMAVYADNVTHLTTTVPDAAYTLNIPADQEIAFGTTEKEIGSVNVTDSNGFANGKNLKVYVEHTDFESETVSTTIPYELKGAYTYKATSSSSLNGTTTTTATGHCSLSAGLIFLGNTDGTVNQYAQYSHGGDIKDVKKLAFIANSSDWGKALGGDYHSEITFTAEVVVE